MSLGDGGSGALGQIGGGIGGLIGGLLGSPSIPSAMHLSNKAISNYYYGLKPKELDKYQSLQALVAGGSELNKHDQTKLDKLSSKSASNAILPQQFAQQQEWLPQFMQTAMDALGTQAGGLADLQQSLTQQLNPEYQQVQQKLGQYVGDNVGQGLNPDQLKFFGQQLAQQQAAQGLYGSPLSSQNMAYQLTGMNLAQQQQNIGNAMQYGSAYPNIGNAILGLGVNSSPSGMSLSGGSVTPTSFEDYQNQVNQLAGLGYQSRVNDNNQLKGNISNITSGLFGLAGGGGGIGSGGQPSFMGNVGQNFYNNLMGGYG